MVVIRVRPVVHAKPDILLPGVQENQIEHVLHQHTRVLVPMVQERQDLLLDALVVHRAIVIIN